MIHTHKSYKSRILTSLSHIVNPNTKTPPHHPSKSNFGGGGRGRGNFPPFPFNPNFPPPSQALGSYTNGIYHNVTFPQMQGSYIHGAYQNAPPPLFPSFAQSSGSYNLEHLGGLPNFGGQSNYSGPSNFGPPNFPGPSTNGSIANRDDLEFGISTQNRFYPLRDLNGPNAESDVIRVDQQNTAVMGPPNNSQSSNIGGLEYAGSGPLCREPNQWGFHKPGQGTKRTIDRKEEPEEEEGYELKRKKL